MRKACCVRDSTGTRRRARWPARHAWQKQRRSASHNQRLLSFEEVRWRHLQRLREAGEVRHAEIVPSLLDVGDVGPFDLGGVREVLLGPPARQAEATNSLAKLLEKWVGGRGHPASSAARSDQVHGKSATSHVRKCLHLAGSRGSRLSIGVQAAPSMQRNSFPHVRQTYMLLVHLSVAARQTSLTSSILVSDIVQIVVPGLLLHCPRRLRWFSGWKEHVPPHRPPMTSRRSACSARPCAGWSTLPGASRAPIRIS